MYTQQDYDRAGAQLKRRIVIAAIVLAIGLAALIAALIVRNRIVTIAAAVLTGWVLYGYISLKLVPHYHYRKYLMDIRQGRSRDSEGWFVSASDETRRVDGVSVHDVIVRVGDGEEDERLFYWDDDKPMPAIPSGQRVHIHSFGNFIIALTQL
ncbi:MAG: hypothetical protein GX558_04320 [Clostridiales bacterium]|nr:hypothetical protein [Clostridiales bacterium]